MLNLIAAHAAVFDDVPAIFQRLFADQSQYSLDMPGPVKVLACVLSALALGILIGLVYMFTHRKTGYTQSYVLAMPMLSGLVATILVLMCVLSSGVGVTAAISLTGAFSLVRFRSAPGDPRDIAYVFFAMVMGTVCGVGFIGYAFLIFIIMAAALIIFNLINFWS